MRSLLTPLSEQIMIITGASGEIGLVTTRMAAQKGAKVVVADKIDDELVKLSDEINDQGGTAVYVQADMSKESDVQRVIDTTIRTFGTFDTWVNITGEIAANAGVSSMEDMKKMFDTNFWGVVYGSRIAATHLKNKTTSGAIINVDSFFADRPSPLQAVYSATKHAVQSWTDDLRTELNKEKIPVSVSFIHPREMDNHANQMESANSHIPAVTSVHARAIAEAIVYCAEHPKREILVGPRNALTSVLSSVTPRLINKVRDAASLAVSPAQKRAANYSKSSPLVRNNGQRYTGILPHSFYQKALKHPLISTIAFAGLGASIWMWAKRKYKAIENH